MRLKERAQDNLPLKDGYLFFFTKQASYEQVMQFSFLLSVEISHGSCHEEVLQEKTKDYSISSVF